MLHPFLQYLLKLRDQSKIEITKEALKLIAILAEGAMRDALSILERCLQEGSDSSNVIYTIVRSCIHFYNIS